MPDNEPDRGPFVAIAMATYEPRADLLARQIQSLREQTHENWVCVVSDDASGGVARAAIEKAVGGDSRFRVSRSGRRLGFYRNFERALELVPAEAELVAFADQDDRWHPDKLATLVRAIDDGALAYSDARVVRPSGTVVAETMWGSRSNNHSNLASLLLANTVTGATSLFRREVLDVALPLPEAPGQPYHDHWVALVALVTGRLVYVDRPLMDYVQHEGSVLGHEAIEARPQLSRVQRLRRLRGDPRGAAGRWRDAYELEWLRVRAFAEALRQRCGDRLRPRDRRALNLVLARERSPRMLGWLAFRPLRGLIGRNETRGFEHRLLRGLIWRNTGGRSE